MLLSQLHRPAVIQQETERVIFFKMMDGFFIIWEREYLSTFTSPHPGLSPSWEKATQLANCMLNFLIPEILFQRNLLKIFPRGIYLCKSPQFLRRLLLEMLILQSSQDNLHVGRPSVTEGKERSDMKTASVFI